jgi:hypothetical protein
VEESSQCQGVNARILMMMNDKAPVGKRLQFITDDVMDDFALNTSEH